MFHGTGRMPTEVLGLGAVRVLPHPSSDVNRAVQLQIEYAPRPPYDSGTRATACPPSSTRRSGSPSPEAHNAAVQRMIQAGAVPVTWFSVAAEFQLDPRFHDAPHRMRLMQENMPAMAMGARAFVNGVDQGKHAVLCRALLHHGGDPPGRNPRPGGSALDFGHGWKRGVALPARQMPECGLRQSASRPDCIIQQACAAAVEGGRQHWSTRSCRVGRLRRRA
ncbi:hypothetical protein TPA0905_32370 [Streptomyces olivaceus]|nr:hypothetical protein TPA0905_32370 [Streptomyces olivaceus]